MRKSYLISVAVLFLLITVSWSWAEPVKMQIPYKKVTTLAYPSAPTLRFSLWDAEEVGTGVEVWSEEKILSLTSNVIKTNLGDINLLDPADFEQQLWVQVEKKKADSTYKVLGKRDALAAAPYALGGGGGAGVGYASVQAYGFIPVDNTTTWGGYLPSNGVRVITGGTLQMAAPISFPEGATLTEMKADVYDYNNPGYISVSLWKYTGYGAEQIANVSTTDADVPGFTTISSAFSHVVSTSSSFAQGYYLVWEQSIPGNLSIGPGLYSVRVGFTNP